MDPGGAAGAGRAPSLSRHTVARREGSGPAAPASPPRS